MSVQTRLVGGALELLRYTTEVLLTVLILTAALLPGLPGFEWSLQSWLMRYDPHLAVLSATAIAVLWYTGATFRSLSFAQRTRMLDELASLHEFTMLLNELLICIEDLPETLTVEARAEGSLDSEQTEQQLLGFRGIAAGRWSADITILVYQARMLRDGLQRVTGAPTENTTHAIVSLWKRGWDTARAEALASIGTIQSEVSELINARTPETW